MCRAWWRKGSQMSLREGSVNRIYKGKLQNTPGKTTERCKKSIWSIVIRPMHNPEGHLALPLAWLCQTEWKLLCTSEMCYRKNLTVEEYISAKIEFTCTASTSIWLCIYNSTDVRVSGHKSDVWRTWLAWQLGSILVSLEVQEVHPEDWTYFVFTP